MEAGVPDGEMKRVTPARFRHAAKAESYSAFHGYRDGLREFESKLGFRAKMDVFLSG